MRHITSYKIFETLQGEISLRDVLECYQDSFIELSDLGAYIGVSDTKNLVDINPVLDGKVKFFKLNQSIDRSDFILDTSIFGRVGGINLSNERLKEMYYYMRENLLNNETRFEELTGLKLVNRYTTVTVREWDVYPTDKRYDDIVKNNSLKGRQHHKVQYNKDENNRGYVEYNIYVHKGILYDRPTMSNKIKRKISSFFNWIKGNKYDFPELKSNIDIRQIEISHEISDIKHYS
jgi:hypothetical protein